MKLHEFLMLHVFPLDLLRANKLTLTEIPPTCHHTHFASPSTCTSQPELGGQRLILPFCTSDHLFQQLHPQSRNPLFWSGAMTTSRDWSTVLRRRHILCHELVDTDLQRCLSEKKWMPHKCNKLGSIENYNIDDSKDRCSYINDIKDRYSSNTFDIKDGCTNI